MSVQEKFDKAVNSTCNQVIERLHQLDRNDFIDEFLISFLPVENKYIQGFSKDSSNCNNSNFKYIGRKRSFFPSDDANIDKGTSDRSLNRKSGSVSSELSSLKQSENVSLLKQDKSLISSSSHLFNKQSANKPLLGISVAPQKKLERISLETVTISAIHNYNIILYNFFIRYISIRNRLEKFLKKATKK